MFEFAHRDEAQTLFGVEFIYQPECNNQEYQVCNVLRPQVGMMSDVLACGQRRALGSTLCTALDDSCAPLFFLANHIHMRDCWP
jgi:hypothetical protein